MGLEYIIDASDPFCGIDLDDVVDSTGAITPWALKLISELNSYAEISPSGTGVKILVQGAIPSAVTPTRLLGIPDDEPGTIEMYDHGRLWTITGNTVGAYPFAINAADSVLSRLHAALKPGKKGKAAPAAAPGANSDPIFDPDQPGDYTDSYMHAAIADELRILTEAREPGRNSTLNTAAFNLSRFVLDGRLDRDMLETMLYGAARGTGLLDAEIRDVLRRAIDAGLTKHAAPAAPAGLSGTATYTAPTPASTNGNGNGSVPPIPPTNSAPAAPQSAPQPAVPPTFHETDLGNAERLIYHHGNDLHYVPEWDTWLIWDGTRWRRYINHMHPGLLFQVASTEDEASRYTAALRLDVDTLPVVVAD
jgi:putative DNA primase/helicase